MPEENQNKEEIKMKNRINRLILDCHYSIRKSKERLEDDKRLKELIGEFGYESFDKFEDEIQRLEEEGKYNEALQKLKNFKEGLESLSKPSEPPSVSEDEEVNLKERPESVRENFVKAEREGTEAEVEEGTGQHPGKDKRGGSDLEKKREKWKGIYEKVGKTKKALGIFGIIRRKKKTGQPSSKGDKGGGSNLRERIEEWRRIYEGVVEEKFESLDKRFESIQKEHEKVKESIENLKNIFASSIKKRDNMIKETNTEFDKLKERLEDITTRCNALEKAFKQFLPDLTEKVREKNQEEGERKKELIIVEKPNVKWEDIGGLKETKERIRDVITMPLKYPEYLERYGIEPSKGVLLFGPPGCGKSLLAKVAAVECDATSFEVPISDISSKWFGESGKNIKDLFTNIIIGEGYYECSFYWWNECW